MKRFLLLNLCLLPLLVFGQAHHEIGIWGGAANYHGDLQHDWFPTSQSMSKTYKPSLGITYKYFFNPRLGLRFGASYIPITAADSLSPVAADRARNLSFHNNIFEVYGGVEFNFMPVEINRFKFSPYVFAGVGAFYGRPYAFDNNGQKIYLRDLGTEGQGLAQYPDRKIYPLVNAMIPMGGGIKFFVGQTLMIGAEVGFRYTSTDYIDDVSRTYVNLDTLLSYKGQNAVDMSYRGNTKVNWDGTYPNYGNQRGDYKQNDWYLTASISVAIYFRAFRDLKNFIRCPRLSGNQQYQ